MAAIFRVHSETILRYSSMDTPDSGRWNSGSVAIRRTSSRAQAWSPSRNRWRAVGSDCAVCGGVVVAMGAWPNATPFRGALPLGRRPVVVAAFAAVTRSDVRASLLALAVRATERELRVRLRLVVLGLLWAEAVASSGRNEARGRVHRGRPATVGRPRARAAYARATPCGRPPRG